MLKEVVENHSSEKVSVHVVWLPMVDGDDEAAARAAGRMYAHHPVHQYFDRGRIVGLAYRQDVFSNCLKEALSTMPKDHPLFPQLSEWAASKSEPGPLWDAVLFYPAEVQWTERAPTPALWSKQVGFFGSDAGPVTGIFFRNNCRDLPTDSDWHEEVRDGMTILKRGWNTGDFHSPP